MVEITLELVCAELDTHRTDIEPEESAPDYRHGRNDIEIAYDNHDCGDVRPQPLVIGFWRVKWGRMEWKGIVVGGLRKGVDPRIERRGQWTQKLYSLMAGGDPSVSSAGLVI